MKHIVLLMVFISMCKIGYSQNRAPSLYLNYQDEGQGDIIINTLRVESPSPLYTYYCGLLWNSGQDAGGYCGMQEHPDGRNFIYSLWDPISSTDPITVEYAHPNTDVANFGGEGTGLRSLNFGIGWETNQWYSLVSRAWNANSNSSLFGYWVYDQSNSIWHHLVTMNYPVPNLKFNTKTSSFIEDWLGNGSEARTVHHNNGWKRKTSDNSWNSFEKSYFDRVFPDAGTINYIENYDGGVIEDEYYFMTSGGTTTPITNEDDVTVFLTNNASDPGFEKGGIFNLVFDRINDNLNISWEIADSTLPQFSYHFKIFDNHELKGNPVLSVDSTTPHTRNFDLDISSLTNEGEYYTLFHIVDIFDNQSELYTGNLSFASINYSPSISNAIFSIDENVVTGTSIGIVIASDLAGDDLAFSIVSGNDLGAFQIDESTGEILVVDSEPLDFETNPTFNFSVQASDGQLSNTATVIVNVNDVDEVLGIYDQQGNHVRLYPNPTIDFITIEWNNFERATVSELSGKEFITEDTQTLDLRNLNAGIYFITINGSNNEQITFRIVKE